MESRYLCVANGEEVESWGPSSDARSRPAGHDHDRFVLYDETGQPCVTFGYGTHDEARAGREYVVAALIGAETVRGRR